MLRRAQQISTPELELETLGGFRPEPESSGNSRFDRNDFNPRVQGLWFGIRPSRIILLLVALVAGGLAAYLTVQGDKPAQVVTETVTATEVVPEARTQILVAKSAIALGQRLSPASVEWLDWPEGAVRPEYITVAASPNAVTDMTGTVARFEFFPGEPIRPEKLAQPGQGYLSAVLDGGMRGVSVSVAAESASGGFVLPNDHVDVMLTRPTETGQATKTILTNVRVLAINAQLGGTATTEPAEGEATAPPKVYPDMAMATLELDPAQAEVIVNASQMGKLSLVLRAMEDFADAAAPEPQSANQAIRISSPFWQK